MDTMKMFKMDDRKARHHGTALLEPTRSISPITFRWSHWPLRYRTRRISTLNLLPHPDRVETLAHSHQPWQLHRSSWASPMYILIHSRNRISAMLHHHQINRYRQKHRPLAISRLLCNANRVASPMHQCRQTSRLRLTLRSHSPVSRPCHWLNRSGDIVKSENESCPTWILQPQRQCVR